MKTAQVALAAVSIAALAFIWFTVVRRQRRDLSWPDWDEVPRLCAQCGGEVPKTLEVEVRPDVVIELSMAPIPVSCAHSLTASWLCSPPCLAAYGAHHNQLHHGGNTE